MAENLLFSLDRIDGNVAVLIDDDTGGESIVPLSALPPSAEAGKMYRKVEECYVEDADAEQARRACVQALQNRLRRRKN